MWDINARLELKQIIQQSEPWDRINWGPDSQILASARPPNGLDVFGIGEHGWYRYLKGDREVTGAAFHPGGLMLAAVTYQERPGTPGKGNRIIVIWNLSTSEPKTELHLEGASFSSAVYSPDGRLLVAGTEDGRVFCWDTLTYTVVAEFKAHQSSVTQIAFSPDGQMLATGGQDGEIRLWRSGD